MVEQKIMGKIDAFFTQFPHSKHAKGDMLIRAGDEPKGIYYLKKGHIRQYVITTSGEEMTLNIYKPYTFFPMAFVVDAYPNTYYFEAMDESDTCIAPKEDVVLFIKREPDVLLDLVKRLYRGLNGILSRLEFLMSGTAQQKLITILVLSAKRFGEKKEENTVILTLKLTHQDLASLAGLSRETVSREMMILKQRKLIDYTSAFITVYNSANLEKELQ